MNFKDKYELAKKNNKADIFRGDEISRRLSKKYPLSAQIALTMNLMKDNINGETTHYKEWEEYENFRAKIKKEVDDEINKIENE